MVDIARMMLRVEKIPGVAFARDFMFACSAETQDKLAETIKEQSLELVRAAVARAKNLEPLHEDKYDVVSRALVLGGGLAGMTAALAMADQGFKVHLVEKAGRLGGFALNLVETLEGTSPPKSARRLDDRVRSHPNIALHLNSELIEHSGYAGAFEGTVASNRGRTRIEYGAVVNAVGAVPYAPREYLYGKDPRVLTQVELANEMRKDPLWPKRIKSVAMIQCVGSRNKEFPYCGRVCCSAAVKNAIDLKKANPEIQVVVLYRDLRTFGFKELYYLEARKKGVLFFRFVPSEKPEVRDDDGRLVVDFTDRSSRRRFRVKPDLVVLSSGMRPAKDGETIARLLKLHRTPEGFFMEAHVKLRPVEFATAGIFLAGLAHSPRFAAEAVVMAKGAAQQAVKILCRKEMPTAPNVAVVDPDRCTACLACVRVCPFGAPFANKEGISEIPPAKCRGCGICPGECPAMAITLKHSTDGQICAKYFYSSAGELMGVVLHDGTCSNASLPAATRKASASRGSRARSSHAPRTCSRNPMRRSTSRPANSPARTSDGCERTSTVSTASLNRRTKNSPTESSFAKRSATPLGKLPCPRVPTSMQGNR